MATVDDIPKTYDDAIITLARWNGEEQDPPLTIYAFPDPENEVVRLVEIGDGFPETGEAMPFSMGPSPDFPFKSVVVLLTPGEWDRVQRGELQLPEAWELGKSTRVWPK